MVKEDHDNITKMVKEGYNEIAEIYEQFTDRNTPNLEIFKQFVSLIDPKKRILELGCGSGSPTCNYFFSNGFQYTGVDLSEKQLELAKKFFPKYKNNFREGEMLSYTKSQQEKSFDALIALFCIFHLPKYKHLELFKNIKRILTDGSPVLFTAADSENEGTEDNWIGGGKTMFWSNYPFSWYEEKLTEIGFKHINTFRREFEFANEIEIQYFLLFQA